MCTALSIGLVSVFKTVAHSRKRLLDKLSDGTYGVYVLHVPVVVLLQFALQRWQMAAGSRFVVESALGIALTFLLTLALRSIPWVRKIM